MGLDASYSLAMNAMSSSDTWMALVRQPDSAEIYRRDDPHDQRLGDLIQTDPAAYPAARVVLLGFPYDEGVRRNRGRPGAAQAPAAIRQALYRMSSGMLAPSALFDLGDSIGGPTLEAGHATHQAVVEGVLRDGKRLIVLGGGNDVAYPDAAGLAAVAGAMLAFNIDAHFDVRADTPRNSGTPYRQLLDEGLLAPACFYQLGSQPYANSPVYTRYLHEHGVRVVPMAELRAAGIAATLKTILAQHHERAIFWGFDLDVVRAADAPGVSAPNALGMEGEEFCRLAAIAGADRRTRLIEFSELNPAYDLDGRTSRLAAAAIWHALMAE
jgi:formiminoglutamase